MSVFLLAAIVRIKAAEEELKIENFSAKPRLQEDGRLYNVEVRFTTNIASFARLRYGADNRCAETMVPESELRRNHRFDILNVPVVRPKVAETTALGAAYAAGLAVGFWENTEDLRDNWQIDKMWQPTMDERDRLSFYNNWQKAVQRTLDWVV